MIYFDLKHAMLDKHYEWYDEPMQLNIIGVRQKLHTNAFDDKMFLAYLDHTLKPMVHEYDITTDPGKMPLMLPSNSKGTAILVPGQYKSYSIDYHRGRYPALCQRIGSVCVYRDSNENSKHDLDPSTIDCGYFGINIHKAGKVSSIVDGWSAGCQVFKKALDFDHFMKVVKFSSKIRRDNSFTYTLVSQIKQEEQ